jgi:hypothetical protein
MYRRRQRDEAAWRSNVWLDKPRAPVTSVSGSPTICHRIPLDRSSPDVANENRDQTEA